MSTMWFRVILTTIGVGLQLAPSVANVVDDMCNGQCNRTMLTVFNERFKNGTKAYIVPSNDCFSAKIEIFSYGAKYTFFENGKVKSVLDFNTTDNGTCMRDNNGAFVVFLPLEDCEDNELALGFICPTQSSALVGYVVARQNSMVSKECANEAIMQLENLNYNVSHSDVYKCINVEKSGRESPFDELIEFILEILKKLFSLFM